MSKLTVVVEEFRPKRKPLAEFKTTVPAHMSMTEYVRELNKYIEEALQAGWYAISDETTEVRWEFKEYEQGHYISTMDELHDNSSYVYAKMEELKKYALSNYEAGGHWMVECWEDDDWKEFINKYAEAELLEKLLEVMTLLEDRARDTRDWYSHYSSRGPAAAGSKLREVKQFLGEQSKPQAPIVNYIPALTFCRHWSAFFLLPVQPRPAQTYRFVDMTGLNECRTLWTRPAQAGCKKTATTPRPVVLFSSVRIHLVIVTVRFIIVIQIAREIVGILIVLFVDAQSHVLKVRFGFVVL